MLLHSVDFIIVGGFVRAFHSDPRNTGNIDIWIRLAPSNALKLRNALEAFAFRSFELEIDDFTKPDQVIHCGYPLRRIDLLTDLTALYLEVARKTFT